MTSSAINLPSYQPLYEQIRSLLTQALIDREWLPGDVLPSEFKLASRYNVSQGTVRKAIDSLASENILIRRQGRGTFVATHQTEKIKLRFLRLASADGNKEALQSALLSCEKAKADKQVAKQLNIKSGASVIEVKRLLTFAGRPVIYDHIIVPTSSFKGLSAEKVESHSSLYRMYELEFGVRMIRAEEKLKAVLANQQEADVLGIEKGFPLLSIERVSYTYDDKPMEWRLGMCITDDHHYMNELE